ncbi:hypothetical protein PUR59_12290 [Streptomyces sp. SP18ES09]|uniref:hypothetical protein n=1 Tax=Streptomyces sp. SP18ES09 TaxID=3002532 RepID=UPI002E76F4B2|nr:hypothetical protein [Streptomyces sp. SP18ES09]MEE1815785.1 hypothetical protein [Streptomyces sp. SP18ES09]
MTYRRAVIPALAGGLLLTALLWWAGASADALHLPGSGGTLGIDALAELRRWLTPWAYDPPLFLDAGGQGSGSLPDTRGDDGRDRYTALYTTGLQIRFAAVFVLFVLGALLLVRRLPPLRGRATAAFLALWAWAAVAGTLAVTVSAPWLIASTGHGSYRFLPQLANVIASGRQLPLAVGLVVAGATVLLARTTAGDTGRPPRTEIPARSARLAATAGTAVVALSLVVLSYRSVAAALQEFSPVDGLLSEPGDLLRQWLLLGGWSGPEGGPLGDWLLYRAPDVLLLVVVWWALRLLPGLLTRATLPATAVGAVCATVLGLLASRLLRIAVTRARSDQSLLYSSAGLGDGIPAALVVGLAAGVTTALVLRSSRRGTRTSGG